MLLSNCYTWQKKQKFSIFFRALNSAWVGFLSVLNLIMVSGYVHTKPDKFENATFAAKTDKMLSVHINRFQTVSLSTLKRCLSLGGRRGIFQLKIFRIPLFSRGEYSHSLIIFRRIFLISKFSAPTIAFLAFWLAKKLRLSANIPSFTSYGK